MKKTLTAAFAAMAACKALDAAGIELFPEGARVAKAYVEDKPREDAIRADTEAAWGASCRGWWFDRARYGVFIHYGAYSVAARGEWVKNREKLSNGEYTELYAKNFKAEKLDCAAWAHCRADGRRMSADAFAADDILDSRVNFRFIECISTKAEKDEMTLSSDKLRF